MNRSLRFLFVAALVSGASAWVVACDGDSNAVKEPVVTPDASPPLDGSVPGPDGSLLDGGPIDCFTNPKTHFEIINACTNAVRITKNPTLPLLLPDGGLPPAP